MWESQARADPLWAVLSEQDKRGRSWKLDEFLATGEAQVAAWMERVERAGVTIRPGSALDFGCGVGRLSQALGGRFARVTGVDISPTMIAVARRINRHGARVEYVLNQEPHLAFVPSRSVDLVLTHITLQHIPPPVALGYLEELFRIVAPGGVLVFQVPSRLRTEVIGAPADAQPLASQDSRVELALAEALPQLVARQPVQIAVRVRNASRMPWEQAARFPLNLGNHWLDRAGTTAINDDGRERLPPRLGPGEEVTLRLLLVPPATPGPAILELDVVQEGVRWFKDAGSRTLRLEVAVVAPPTLLAVTPTVGGGSPTSDRRDFSDLLEPFYAPPPAFEMHGIPRAEVLALIARHGGRVLAIDEHLTEWESFGYSVQAGG